MFYKKSLSFIIFWHHHPIRQEFSVWKKKQKRDHFYEYMLLYRFWGRITIFCKFCFNDFLIFSFSIEMNPLKRTPPYNQPVWNDPPAPQGVISDGWPCISTGCVAGIESIWNTLSIPATNLEKKLSIPMTAQKQEQKRTKTSKNVKQI